MDKDPSKSHPPIRKMQYASIYDDEVSGIEYWIPNDNPFLSPDGTNYEEYYTLGHRNPYRMTKDRVTGTLYIGEIGESTHEEINVVSKGKNYGWPVFEGHAPGPSDCTTLFQGMADEKPLVSFPRSDANSLIGGYVYRGGEIPDLYGRYICADFGNGDEIWSVDTQTGNYTLLGNFQPANIISFGEDTNGEIYMMKYGDNVNLYKMKQQSISYEGIPQNLSATGAFTDLGTLTVSEGLIPYDLPDPFWSDGAHVKRWMAIPNDGTHNTPEEKIIFSENGDWDFPIGSVLVQHFDLPIDEGNPNITKKIETRFSIKGQDGQFYFLTYKWNQSQTEAFLQTTAADEMVTITLENGETRSQRWHYPSNSECISCHNNVTKGSIGPRTRYLNNDYTYGKTNITANQLVTLSHLGILDQVISDDDTPNFLTSKSIYDSNATMDEKTRSYLDLNCAFCHRPGTDNRAEFDLRLFNSLEETGLLTAGTLTPLGIDGEKIIVPGDASKSILYHRTNSAEPSIMMPPFAKNVIDEDAVNLIEAWINSLGGNTNQPPVAIISADPTTGDAPLEVNFIGSNSTDDVAVFSYLWDFDDGFPPSTEANPIHSFSSSGTYEVELTVSDNEGLTNTNSITIVVNDPPNQAPVAVLHATPLNGIAPLEVSFTGGNSTDDVDINGYLWNFGDGSDTSTTANPVHTFSTPGTYIVELRVEDIEGLFDTDTITIVVDAPPNEPPVAVAEASPLNGFAPLEVNFTGSNSTDDVGINSYLWDFGDGSTKSLQADPTHMFNFPGTYSVNLRVEDEVGLRSNAVVTITVEAPANLPPSAVIEADVTQGSYPLEIKFTGSNSTDDFGVIGYSWDFKDGSPLSTAADPVHTFLIAGTYNVELTVVDAEDLSGTATITIVVSTPENQPPQAVATVTPLKGNAPLEVSFTGSNSTDDSGLVGYLWDFGDGFPTSNLADPVHTYEVAGTYSAKLTVNDDEGLINTVTITIEVDTPPNQSPVAVIYASPKNGDAPLKVNFRGDYSTDDNQVVAYVWNFDDDTPGSTEVNPSHTFSTPGTYLVGLQVQDEEGLTDEASMAIVVGNPPNQPPVAVIGATPLTGDAPLEVSFTGEGSTDDLGVVGYNWDFKDGSPFSTEINPTHVFSKSGTYVVELKVEDEDGLTDTSSVSIMVSDAPNQAPVAVITASPLIGNVPLKVDFSGSNSVDDKGAVHYNWNFNDGSPNIAVANTSHIFEEANTYLVELTVEDAEGLTNTATVTIEVLVPPNHSPTAIIDASPIRGEAPMEVNFTANNSNDDNDVVSYSWDFRDGSPTSPEVTVSHLFENSGVYGVSLTVVDGQGLTDTATVTILVLDNTASGDVVGTLLVNPAKDFATIRLIDNGRANRFAEKLYIHDSSGRMVGLYDPRDLFAHGVYKVPISSLSIGNIYFIGLAMNDGTVVALKLLVDD